MINAIRQIFTKRQKPPPTPQGIIEGSAPITAIYHASGTLPNAPGFRHTLQCLPQRTAPKLTPDAIATNAAVLSFLRETESNPDVLQAAKDLLDCDRPQYRILFVAAPNVGTPITLLNLPVDFSRSGRVPAMVAQSICGSLARMATEDTHRLYRYLARGDVDSAYFWTLAVLKYYQGRVDGKR